MKYDTPKRGTTDDEVTLTYLSIYLSATVLGNHTYANTNTWHMHTWLMKCEIMASAPPTASTPCPSLTSDRS